MAVHVKGLVLRARMDYIEKHFGEEALARVIEQLPPESRAVLDREIMVSSWYPLAALTDMAVALDRLHGRGDLATCREMGRNAAQMALQGVHRSFAKENDPAFVLRMAPLLWGQYYDSGRSEVESTGKNSAVTRIFEFEEPHRAICLGVVGWMEAAIQIWGGLLSHVEETRCRVRGDECCEFMIRWVEDPMAPPQSK